MEFYFFLSQNFHYYDTQGLSIKSVEHNIGQVLIKFPYNSYANWPANHSN